MFHFYEHDLNVIIERLHSCKHYLDSMTIIVMFPFYYEVMYNAN